MLNQFFYCTDIKESRLFMAEIVETLDLNNLRWPDGLAAVFSSQDRFQNKEGNI